MTRQWKARLCLVVLLVSACTQREPHQTSELTSTTVEPTNARISFLGREGCVNTPKLLANLESALEASSITIEYATFDQLKLPESDPRRGYPTPTILLDGEDIFGLPEPEPPFTNTSCRHYSDGLPTSEMIADRLGTLLE